MICPDCGMEIDLEDAKTTFDYVDLPYPMCYDCAQRYVDAIFLNEAEKNGYTFGRDGDLISYEEFEADMERNPTGEYYHE